MMTSNEVAGADRAGGTGDVEQQVVGVDEAVIRQVDRQEGAAAEGELGRHGIDAAVEGGGSVDRVVGRIRQGAARAGTAVGGEGDVRRGVELVHREVDVG